MFGQFLSVSNTVYMYLSLTVIMKDVEVASRTLDGRNLVYTVEYTDSMVASFSNHNNICSENSDYAVSFFDTFRKLASFVAGDKIFCA